MNNKKFGRILLALIVTVSSFFGLVSEVFAEDVPKTINISSSAAVKGFIGDNVNFGTKTLNDGTVAYCLDYHKQTTVNTVGTLVGEMDAGMTYLIENGYPYKSITNDKEMDYYITQTAIWWYLDDTTGASNLDNAFKTTDSDPYELRSIIKTLVDNAKIAKTKGYKNPVISLSTTNNYLSVISGKEYYVSNDVVVNLTDLDSYTVSLTDAPEGSYITDTTGNKKTTFKGGETFRIFVPSAKVSINKTTIKVSVSSSTTYNKVYEYAPPSTEEQNLAPAILYPTTVNVAKDITFTVASNKVIITKIDASTKKTLAGAVLVIKDKDGNEIERFTTTEDVYTIYNLANGTYTVEEVSSPEGYALSDKKYTFTIDNDNREQSVTFENFPAVFVPDTLSNSSIIMYVIGSLIIISGIGFAVYNAQIKKQK